MLVEVHDAPELQTRPEAEDAAGGINNRDLRSFGGQLQTTLALQNRCPPTVCWSPSPASAPADVRLMRDAGVNMPLVGEAFMRASDPGLAFGVYSPERAAPAAPADPQRREWWWLAWWRCSPGLLVAGLWLEHQRGWRAACPAGQTAG